MGKLLLILIVVFLMVYSLGLGSFFSVNFLNIALIIIGLVGCIITTIILGKRLENIRKKRIDDTEKQLDALKKLVDRNKLKDNGTDIDELVRILKENDIELSDNKPL